MHKKNRKIIKNNVFTFKPIDVILNQCELGQLCRDWYYPNREWQLRREWRMCYLLFVDYLAIRQSRREWLISI